VLTETAEETLSEVDRNCLTMVKTNGPNSLIGTNKREGLKGDSLAAVVTE
jgi:hypothetical protein